MIKQYSKTALTAALAQTNGGLASLAPVIFVRLIKLIPLMLLWRVVAADGGAGSDMSLSQLLGYTYLGVLLSDLLSVETVMSSWCYEGELQKLYTRPSPIFGQVIAQTAGGWLPGLLFFSLPMLCAAPLFGVPLLPDSPWFFLSLALCVSLGFAVDFIFACVSINLRGMFWLSYVIRSAVAAVLSGSLIPFKILPFGLEKFFSLQPFGSLGGAPLSLFAGSADPFYIIGVQIFWNLVLWPAAALWFKKSQERMVSFGG